jgi:hypothetical protein
MRRGHHRELHQAGNEVAWWHNFNIKALENAKILWDQSRTKQSPAQELRGACNETDRNKSGTHGNAATINDAIDK